MLVAIINRTGDNWEVQMSSWCACTVTAEANLDMNCCFDGVQLKEGVMQHMSIHRVQSKALRLADARC